MICIPIPDERTMVVVIQPDNLARMKQGDPITIQLSEYGLSRCSLIVCFEEIADTKIAEMMREKGKDGFLRYLGRGYQTHPDDADGDAPRTGLLK